MVVITPPIFLIDDGDVLKFDSVKSAEIFLEPIDVQRGEGSIYDGRGYKLYARLEKEVSTSKWFGLKSIKDVIKISLSEAAEPDPEELRKHLLSFLKNTLYRKKVPPTSFEAMSVEELAKMLPVSR